MILIIDNYDSFTYNLYQCIAQHTSDIQVHRNDKITADDIETINPQGIVFSPGPGRPEDAGICIDAIRRMTGRIPMLGVCLGLQAMAIAFGGRVVAAPTIIHGKHDLIFHTRKGLYDSLPLPFQAGRYHSLAVERSSLPNCLMIEAENTEEIIMGIRHTHYPIFGMQFHPESILTPQGHLLLQRFVQLCTI